MHGGGGIFNGFRFSVLCSENMLVQTQGCNFAEEGSQKLKGLLDFPITQPHPLFYKEPTILEFVPT